MTFHIRIDGILAAREARIERTDEKIQTNIFSYVYKKFSTFLLFLPFTLDLSNLQEENKSPQSRDLRVIRKEFCNKPRPDSVVSLGGTSGRHLRAAPLGGISGWRLWVTPLGGVSGWHLWAAPLGGVSGRRLWVEFKEEIILSLVRNIIFYKIFKISHTNDVLGFVMPCEKTFCDQLTSYVTIYGTCTYWSGEGCLNFETACQKLGDFRAGRKSSSSSVSWNCKYPTSAAEEIGGGGVIECEISSARTRKDTSLFGGVKTPRKKSGIDSIPSPDALYNILTFFK